MSILKVITFAIKHRGTAPLVIKFFEEVMESVGDRKISNKEKSRMVSAFWNVVKAIQQTKKTGNG